MSTIPNESQPLSRRTLLAWGAMTGAALLSGCHREPPLGGVAELVYGEPGERPGQLKKPRAIAIDPNDPEDWVYIVDKTGRVQVFSRDGEFSHDWRTPEIYNGKPSGMSFDRHGNLMVADTHYYRVLFYTPQGELLEDRTIGGVAGKEPGEFGFVTDAVQGNYDAVYVSEYGEFDRIQKFENGKFLYQFGGHGSEPGEFLRPQNMSIELRENEPDRIWVADACNHRIQVFEDREDSAEMIQIWGEQGEETGKLCYPYDLLLGRDGESLYVCEFGNHRVQKFTRDGTWISAWGGAGRSDAELYQPWAFAQDSKGRLHVLDTYSHQVKRVWL